MKNKILMLMLSGTMLMTIFGQPVFASHEETGTEGYSVEMDSIISEANEAEGTAIIFKDSKGRAPTSVGGDFWVGWSAEKHYAYFTLKSKTHRTSCSNNKATVRGDWVPGGYTASSWIYSTLTGNKANWATK